MKLRYSFLFNILIFSFGIQGGGFFETIENAGKNLLPKVESGSKIFISVEEEKRQQLDTLKAEQKELADSEKSFIDGIRIHLDLLSEKIAEINKRLAMPESVDYEFLNKEHSVLSENYQVLKETQQLWEQLVADQSQHVKVLSEYIADSSFKHFKKEHDIGKIYSFESLQDLNQLILEFTKNLATLTEQEKNASVELESRKKSASATQASLKKATRQEEEKMSDGTSLGNGEIGRAQRGELGRLDIDLLNDRRKLDDLRLQEINARIGLIKTKIFMAKEQLEVLKDELTRVKPSIKVRDTDVFFAQAELEKKRQESFSITEGYRQAIDKVGSERDLKLKEFEELSKRFNVAPSKELDDWSKTARTVSDYVALCAMGDLNEQVGFLTIKKEHLDVLLNLENEKTHQEKLRVDIKETFFKITARKFKTQDEISKELKKYETTNAEINANLLGFKQRKEEINDHIAHKKKNLEIIRSLAHSIERQRNTLFKRFPREFSYCVALLNDAYEQVKAEADVLVQVQSAYGDLITVINSEQKNIDFIIAWLGGLSPWHRPEQAISWEGFKNLFSDIELFLLDVRSYVSQISAWSFFERLKDILFSPWQLLVMLVKVGLFLLIAAMVRLYLPYVSNRLLLATGTWRWVSLLGSCMCGFFSRYFTLFFAWFFIRILLGVGLATDLYVYVIFYLLSVPYFLYLTYRFIAYFTNFNIRQGYGLLSKSFQRRFIWMLYTVLYPTVAIYFFRQAFILSSYYKSEIPAILLAINFIIFQIAVIFLISKDQVLDLIPTKPDFWEMVHTFVNRYFYAILAFVIAVIVMSNPYIGFGRLVWHVLKGLLFTYILLRILFALHSYIRKFSSRFFFSTDENEVVHDRFAYAKTWYGIFIIASLLIFMALGLVICLRIWGWTFGLDDIIEWLQTPIFTIASNQITTLSLFRVVAFVLGGFVVSHIINRYVLNRVFELLLVDVGIQNTLASILEYLIIISAVFLGFNNAGLGSIVGYLLGALILSIGWVIKEPVSDFIAYFILIVQRPIKIGDYIRMDEEIRGVVRKITPRSVVIRKNNSHTIVLPNTRVINKPIYNWNYVRNFIAFDDIHITIAFREDPVKVKELLVQAVHSNPNVLKNPKPIIRLDEFKEYGYVFLVRGFLSSDLTLEQWDIASDVRFAIMKVLREHSIEIASALEVVRVLAKNGQKKDLVE